MYGLTCVVSDGFFPWSTDAASLCGITRFVFHGTCFFSSCAIECVSLYQPHKMTESGYADHYRKVLGRKAWHTGPFWLWSCAVENKAKRGKEALVDEHECLKWLGSKKANSAVYVCFGIGCWDFKNGSNRWWAAVVGDSMKREGSNSYYGRSNCIAMKLGEMAARSVEEGWTSPDFNAFIEELKSENCS
ncbi:hypothetical protein SADUNF_Sadunf02G0132200 [Salix dunnii]|uniref:Uncharacterized protein n=1 Tax=Salix dunnii TaxID=1413687 RepID=A0A835N7Z9_9ROSI|nr:hypothetical protein SADUNF_Sadunf02G0132200 [Salix dunnii]